MRTALEPLAADAALRPGALLAVLDDGRLLVETGDGVVTALFVRTSAAPPPALTLGDALLLAVDARGGAYVLGVVGPYAAPPPAAPAPPVETGAEPAVVHVRAARVHVEATDELRLTCGDGALVMDRRGKVVVRGNQLVSRARGANKIKGASVAIN